jgi:hypothetical protein
LSLTNASLHSSRAEDNIPSAPIHSIPSGLTRFVVQT